MGKKYIYIFTFIFAQQITNIDKLGDALGAFFAFSFVASAIYCFNDLLDIDADRMHPRKCKRPLASGAVSKSCAIVIIVVLLGLASFIVGYAHYKDMVPYLLGFYLLMNIAYTLKLKHVVIVDVLIIAVGFVLRLAVGGAATDLELSHWIILMTFLLALFMAFAKRLDDVLIYKETGVKMRANIARYNVTFLNWSY